MKAKLVYLSLPNIQNLAGKLLLADTSFILKAAKSGTPQNTIKNKLFIDGCALAFNVTILAEAIHITRFEMIEHHIKSGGRGVTQKIKDTWNAKRSRSEKMKDLLKSHQPFVSSIMGKNGLSIKQQVDYVFDGCTYKGSSSSVSASWDDVYKIVGEAGLDSSDAMILNLALSNVVFDGVITSDSDYSKAALLSAGRKFAVYLSF